MKRVFISFSFLAVAALSLACGSSATNNANSENANASAAVDLTSLTTPEAALAEGNRLLDENQTPAAIEVYKHAISLNPDLADAHFQLGIALELLDLQNKQQGVNTGASESNSKGKPAKTESEKAFEKAAAAYEKRIDANAQDHAAYFNLGRTYVKLLRDEDAEKAFKQAVKLKPDDTEYQTELGSILIVLAEYGQAIGPLKKPLELDPSNARAEEMLEDAQAGRQRINYVGKNTNQANSNKAANSNSNAASNSNSNSAPPPPANAKPKVDPLKTPKPANRP